MEILQMETTTQLEKDHSQHKEKPCMQEDYGPCVKVTNRSEKTQENLWKELGSWRANIRWVIQ